MQVMMMKLIRNCSTGFNLIPRAESFVFTGGHGGGGFIVDELNNIFTASLIKI